jgi:hypothetical protein
MGSWISALPSYLVVASILLLPGGIVVAAGWGVRNPSRWLLAPALSVTIAAASATIAPFIGLHWSLLPLALGTALIAAIALLLRRFAQPDPAPGKRRTGLTVAVTLAVVAVITTVMFARAFGGPENIAQRFDNIVHLNAIALAVQTGDASPFQIGATSDIGAYPNGWHALATLAVELTGASVPVAVNATNLAVVGILWPASTMALAGALFAQRRTAYVVAGALSTGFGAFPALFFNWGVLYPNVVGYAMIPAGFAAVVACFGQNSRGSRVRALLLAVLLAGGTGLGHPNAFLALLAFSAAYVISALAVRLVAHPSRRHGWAFTIAVMAFALVIGVVWAIARTSAEHSGWSPWQNIAQAIGEAVTVAPRGFTPTVTILLLLLAGVVAVARRPVSIPVVAPFLVAVTFFVVSSGFAIDHWFRQWLTNPWYNDSNRLAALIPIVAIPVATLGALWLFDAVRGFAERRRFPTWVRITALVLAGAATLSVAVGPNVRTALGQVHEAYAYTDDSLILSTQERLLLDRVDDETPDDALLIGSPRTGASLALALSDREVTQRHIFGSPSPELVFLYSQLRNIDSDPQVCSTVSDLGVDYVLDFGRRDVIDEAGAVAFDGVQNLAPGEHLELVDSEGDDARLFRIVGC